MRVILFHDGVAEECLVIQKLRAASYAVLAVYAFYAFYAGNLEIRVDHIFWK
jgi:hypothetical protein